MCEPEEFDTFDSLADSYTWPEQSQCLDLRHLQQKGAYVTTASAIRQLLPLPQVLQLRKMCC